MNWKGTCFESQPSLLSEFQVKPCYSRLIFSCLLQRLKIHRLIYPLCSCFCTDGFSLSDRKMTNKTLTTAASYRHASLLTKNLPTSQNGRRKAFKFYHSKKITSRTSSKIVFLTKLSRKINLANHYIHRAGQYISFNLCQ